MTIVAGAVIIGGHTYAAETTIILPTGGGGTYPDATATGCHQTGLASSKDVTASKNGQVIDGLNITGTLTITGDNVTVRNCRVSTGGYWVIINYGRGTVIENCTLIGGVNTQACIGDADNGYFTGTALDISGSGDGLKMGSGSRLSDSYIHDLATAEGIHNDGIELTGAVNTVVRHNTILNENGQTSCIMLSEYGSNPNTNVLVEDNLLAGGGYTIYGGAPDKAQGHILRGNVFSTRFFDRCGYYGPVAYWSETGNTWENNTWADGPEAGQPVGP